MFKFEKKFLLTNVQREKLLEGAEFLGEEIFTERYFDNAQFSLGLQDMWLWQRGENFHLKIPMHEQINGVNRQYHEIEGEFAIREIFAVPVTGNFIGDLAVNGHVPFCNFTTMRKKYKKENFIINVDNVDYGEWQYQLAEIELSGNDKKEIENINEKIDIFTKDLGLEIMHANGNPIEYLKRKNPQHYLALKKKKDKEKRPRV